MRIKTVRAVAFGSMQNQDLDLADGLTIIYGPNEAGKSTWHAAIHAALCGIRRGPGMRKDDRSFKQRFMPWDGDEWAVTCEIMLPDGTEVLLRRDLLGKIDDGATDKMTGRDLSNTIMFDGAPDASQWLGLNRQSFVATACVRQADILAVTEHADALQEHIERGVGTAGTDATAALALKTIAEYKSEYIGLDRANSTKPLRKAIGGLQSAEAHLEAAQEAHVEYVNLDASARLLEIEADRLSAGVKVAEHRLLDEKLRNEQAKLERAQNLIARFPEGEPRGDDASDLVQRASAALASWVATPSEPVLEGETAEELAQYLATLPETPEGDTEVAPSVTDAHRTYAVNELALENHDAQKPDGSEEDSGAPLSAHELRRLADALETADLEDSDVTEPQGSGNTWIWALAAGSLSLVAGIATALLGPLALGLALAGVGLAAVAVGAVMALRKPAPDIEAIAAQVARQQASQAYASAVAEIEEFSLPRSSATLRELADQRSAAETASQRLASWTARRADLVSAFEESRGSLTAALRERSVEVGDDPDAAFAEYESACRDRAQVAQDAKRRRDLEQRLAQREQLEQRAAQTLAKRSEALLELEAAAAACTIGGGTPEDLAANIREWLDASQLVAEQHEHDVAAWAELQTILGDEHIEHLENSVAALELELAKLATETQGVDLTDLSSSSDLPRARAEAKAAQQEAASARGRERDRSSRIPNVAEAMEEVARARQELDRVRTLERHLNLTQEILEEAEQRTHRNVAPILKANLDRWLPTITNGRYSETAVDVETLEIQVRTPDGLRPATGLSHGTAEQIYLLLRIALVDHLVGTNGPSPLIFDDVTVQSDAERTTRILDMLQEMSEVRQIIVFSQEEEVRRWAVSAADIGSARLIDLSVRSTV